MAQKDLRTLIRLHKWALDDKQRKLGQLLRFEAALYNRKDLIARQYAEEERVANENQTAALTFGAYVEWYIAERDRVIQAIEENKLEILKVRDEIFDAFQELKTFEITQENRDKREKEELERKMGAVLDEIGLNLYRRKKSEEAELQKNPASSS